MWSLFFLSWSLWAVELPRQYIYDHRWLDEVSERSLATPFQTIEPIPLQLTSPLFESLFTSSTSIQSRSQGSPTTSLRGSSQAGRVLFLLDNIPLNFADGFGGGTQFVPTEILGRMHILEGPASALYGPNAVGGVIHFLSQKRETPLLRLGLTETDDADPDLQSKNLAVIYPLFSDENTFLQMSYFTDDDNGDFPFTLGGSHRDRRQTNDQQLSRVTLLGKHKLADSTWTHFWLYSDLRKTTPGSIWQPIITDQATKAFLFGTSFEAPLSPSTLWLSRLSVSGMHSQFQDFSLSKSRSEKLWFSQMVSHQWSDRILSQTLFDLNVNFFSASFVQDQDFKRVEPELAQTIFIPLTERLSLEPSIRYLFRYEKPLFQIQVPWRFEKAQLWASYSEGFRPPSLPDLYANTPFTVANPNLIPEKSHQYEIGQSWQEDGLFVSSSLFYLEYQDLLQSTVLPSTQFTRRNIGSAKTSGFNVRLEITQPRWIWTVSHSYMIARERGASRNPIPLSPEHQFFTSLLWKTSTHTQMTIQQTAWSPVYDINFLNNQLVRLTSWTSTDVLFSWQIDKTWNVNAGVYNLFDQRREMNFGYPEPQRRWALSAEITF